MRIPDEKCVQEHIRLPVSGRLLSLLCYFRTFLILKIHLRGTEEVGEYGKGPKSCYCHFYY